jgi:EpsI family protein
LQIGEWTSTAPASIEKEAQPVGGADAVLVRNYRSQTCGCSMSLQITYYRTQAEMHQQYDFGEYLPEEGWSRISSKLIRLLPAGGQSAAIRYDVVARGSERRALLRWFETRRGAMVNSERLHLYRIWDAMFHRPSDLARVQIVAAGEKKRAELVSPNAIAFAQRVMEEITSLLFRPRRVT